MNVKCDHCGTETSRQESGNACHACNHGIMGGCDHDYQCEINRLSSVFGGGSRKDYYECTKCGDYYYY